MDGPGQGGLLQGRRLVLPSPRARRADRRPWTPTASSGRSSCRTSREPIDRRAPLRRGASRSLRPRRRRPQPAAPDEGACGGSSAFVHDHPVAYAVVGPSFWGDGMYPPSDAVYYPLYTKCCELDLPLCMNTGIPGPPLPGRRAEPDPPRPGVRPLPRAEAVHDPRRRPVVGHRHPADDQVPQPAPDDLGVVAEAPARVAAALHAHAGHRQGPVRVGLPGAVDGAMHLRGHALDLPADVLDKYLYRNANRFFFGNETA